MANQSFVLAGFAALLAVTLGCGGDAPSATPSVPVTPPPPAPVAPQGSYTVSGVVFEHTSSERRPIAGVTLSLHSSAFGGRFLGVTTDANGRYVASGLGRGALTIAPALGSGYVAPCPSGTDVLAGDATFDVHMVSTAQLSAAGAPASLPTTNIYFSGTVYEATPAGKQPVAGAFVELGQSENDTWASTTLTNASGRYLVCTTPPDVGTDQTMRLGVSKDGYVPGSLQVMGGWDYSGADVQLIRR